jgi:hypothetical protein
LEFPALKTFAVIALMWLHCIYGLRSQVEDFEFAAVGTAGIQARFLRLSLEKAISSVDEGDELNAFLTTSEGNY